MPDETPVAQRPLEWATEQELLTELCERSRTVIYLRAQEAKNQPNSSDTVCAVKGPWTEALGLLVGLGPQVKRQILGMDVGDVMPSPEGHYEEEEEDDDDLAPGEIE